MLEEQIIQKLGTRTFGKAANKINRVAQEVLPKEQFHKITDKQNDDINECDGMDGMLLNGEYFDWKEFETRRDDMIKAFLRYFDTQQLQLIADKL